MKELANQYYPTRYWHQLDDGRVQCDLCPRACKMHEGQRGLCFVRKNHDNQIVSTTYGRSSGFCIDPIEKKPLNHFFPGSSVLSFGTAGCNLACKFCQNWDISKSREMDSLSDAASPEQLAQTARKHGAKSIAFTYNDPIIFIEYATDVALACKDENIATVAVTAGYVCDEPRKDFFEVIDATNIDLKAFSSSFYKKLCGGELSNVLDTLQYVYHETKCWLEITTLLIPGENDSNEELEQMCRWLHEKLGPEVPLHFTAFHPDWKMNKTERTSLETLTRARKIAQANGMQYVYTGNVHDTEGSSTYCPNCKEQVIERDWYQLGGWQLHHGACKHCETKIAGHFDAGPDSWGRKRQRVAIDLV